jgi:hypothetical protein
MSGTKIWIVLLCSSFLGACNNEVQPLTAVELRSLIITGSWTLQKLTIADMEKTSTRPGMSVYFTSEQLVTSNAPSNWPQNSSWYFKNKEATIIQFGENIQLPLTEITDSTLVFRMPAREGIIAVDGQKSKEMYAVFSFVRDL